MALPVAAVRPLRAAVLRPGGDAASVVWPADDEPATLHAGVRAPGGEVVAVGSIVREAVPGGQAVGWRVRGMATAPGARGRGLGAAVLDALLAHGAAHGDGIVWCHARPAAASLYERAGFHRVGEPYEHDGLGMHVLLVRGSQPPVGGVPQG